MHSAARWNGRILLLAVVMTALLAGSFGAARAQDTAAEEAANRRAVLARLPEDAAKRVFGQEVTPAAGPAQPIGGYAKGCLAGGVPLPADGQDWEVMRPSRNRAWGHPSLIAFIEAFAAAAKAQAGWPGLLVGDMGQPRGGPMLTGHASHQIGLDADIWLRPMPERRFTPAERDEVSSTNVVAANGDDVDPNVWTAAHRKLLETAARSPNVARIFVNPAIKKALCREAGANRDWLRMIRPWWGHNYHFHVRLRCPPGATECQNQAPPPPGDGCGADLAWWFTPEGRHPEPGPPPRPILMSQMPAGCVGVAQQQR